MIMTTPASMLTSAVQVRLLMTAVLRFLALAMAARAVYLSTTKLPGFLEGSRLASAGFSPTPKFLGTFVEPMMLGALAAAFAFLCRPLAAWLVPIPSGHCPNCQYPTAGLTTSTCPECGLMLRPAPDPRTSPE